MSKSEEVWKFQLDHSFEERKEMAKAVLETGSRIPVIVEKSPQGNQPDISKTFFKLHKDLTVHQLLHIIRQRLDPPVDIDPFLYVGVKKVTPATSSTIGSVHELEAHEDGMLYIMYR